MSADILSDGFIRLCVSTINYYDGAARGLLEGQYVVNNALATPVVEDQVMPVSSELMVDTLFGAGSVLAEALHKAYRTCKQNALFFVIPRKDKVGATKAVYTATITGPATSDGTIDLFLGDDDYSTNGVIVTNGDSVATMAAAIGAALPANCPYVFAAAAGGFTLTAKNAGTVGNFLNPVFNWRGLQNYAPAGVNITFVRTTAGASDPVPLDYSGIIKECCFATYALLGGDRTWQRGMRDWIRSQWSCDKPQCFGHGYTYNSGSLGQVLAAGDNSAEFNRLAVSNTTVTFPWLRVACQMAMRLCAVSFNTPELSVQGRTDGVMRAIKQPMSCSSDWSYTDAKQLKAAGFVIDGPLGLGSGQLTNPYVYNDQTNYLYDAFGREEVTFSDANSRFLVASTALQVATQLEKYSSLGLFKPNTIIPKGVKGTNKRMILADFTTWAKSEVGVLWSEFDNPQRDITLTDDMETAPPCMGVPGKMKMQLRYRPPVRIKEIGVDLIPKMLDNCARVAAA